MYRMHIYACCYISAEAFKYNTKQRKHICFKGINMSKQRAPSAGYCANRCPFPAAANYRPQPPFGTGALADKQPFRLNFQPEKAAVVNWAQYKSHERSRAKFELNARRRLLIKLAFDVMDEDGSGEITVADIKRKYNVKMHPDFISGAKSEDELLGEYLSKFEGGDGARDGRVTLLEFEAYYDKVRRHAHAAHFLRNNLIFSTFFAFFDHARLFPPLCPAFFDHARLLPPLCPDIVSQACCELSDDHFQELMMRVWKVDPAAQSLPKFSRANLRRKALDVPLHPHASDLIDQARSLAKSGGFVVASSATLTTALGCLDRAMLLPNGRVACVRLKALDFFLCPDLMTDAIVCRRAVHALLSLLQDKYASAAMEPAAAKAVRHALPSLAFL
jgi:hypothetical protein